MKSTGLYEIVLVGMVISLISFRTINGMELESSEGSVSDASEEESEALVSVQLEMRTKYYIGLMCFDDLDGIPRYEEARSHFSVTAEQDYDLDVQAWSCMHLAKMYYFGRGVEKNDEIVRGYLERSCAIASERNGLEEISAVAEILRMQNADVNAANKAGLRPLHNAARKGYKEAVDALISRGAVVKVVDEFGSTPLHMASQKGHAEVVCLLIKQGADVKAVNFTGWTVLHDAALGGNAEVVEWLIAHGVQINCANQNCGSTPLHCAVREGHREVVELLIFWEAELKARDNRHRTPLHEAAFFGRNEILELLLPLFDEVNGRDSDGDTPLHLASSRCHKDAVELLIARGADVKAVNRKGWTPLHSAICGLNQKDINCVRTVRILLSSGVDVQAKDFAGKVAGDYVRSSIMTQLLKLNVCCICSAQLVNEQGNVVAMGADCAHRIHAICREGLIEDSSFKGACPLCLAPIKLDAEECVICFEEFNNDEGNNVLIGQNCTHRIHPGCKAQLVQNKTFDGLCPLCFVSVE